MLKTVKGLVGMKITMMGMEVGVRRKMGMWWWGIERENVASWVLGSLGYEGMDVNGE